MKILITGATGFLGSHLTKALVKEGHQLAVLKRSSSDTKRIHELLNEISVYDLDQCPLSQPFRDLGKIDAVFHTATCYGRHGESIQQIFDSNTAFPLKLLETATNFHTDAFFNTDTFFNKCAVVSKYLNSYALSKKHFTEWGQQFADDKKITFINMRLEHVYGPNDDESKFVTHVIKSCLIGDAELNLTNGEHKRDFIYVDDVVSAYCNLLHKTNSWEKEYIEYEVGTGTALSVREFVEIVHAIIGSTTQLKFGAVWNRDNEIKISFANVRPLMDMDWSCNMNISEGIKEIIKQDGDRWV